MSKRCEQCGAVLRDDDRDCPYCGAVISETQTQPAGTYKVPQTIAELKQFCENRGMPLEKMRFFIGEDFREPRAFGIYQDEDGQFVVYKNKDTGERAIRYRGENEAFAVHELYEKLKSETELRRNKYGSRNVQPSGDGETTPIYHEEVVVGTMKGGKNFYKKLVAYVLLLAISLTGAGVFTSNLTRERYERNHGKSGYYEYNDVAYYHYRDDWYYYDMYDYDWYRTTSPFSDYEDERAAEERAYVGESYSSGSFYTDWNDSTWYDDYFSSSSSDSDWSSSDFDSWDSSDTDWGSDW